MGFKAPLPGAPAALPFSLVDCCEAQRRAGGRAARCRRWHAAPRRCRPCRCRPVQCKRALALQALPPPPHPPPSKATQRASTSQSRTANGCAAEYEESVEQYVRRNLGEEVFERLIEPFCRRARRAGGGRPLGAGRPGWGVGAVATQCSSPSSPFLTSPLIPLPALQRRVRGGPQEAVHEGRLWQGEARLLLLLPC